MAEAASRPAVRAKTNKPNGGNIMFSPESANHNGQSFVSVGNAIAKIGEVLVAMQSCLTPESVDGLTKAAFQLAEDLPDIADME